MTEQKKTATVEVTGKVKSDATEAPERVRVTAGSDLPAADTGDTVEVKLVRVEIQRDLERVVSTVPEHEVDLVRAAHGDDRVTVDEDFDAGTATLPADADSEYQRLVRKYNRRNQGVVARVYRDAQEVASALGIKRTRNARNAPTQASVKVRRPAK
jgi:hypothetical protein